MKPYYEHDGILIYHGDCREILPGVAADVIVTDPPYGVSLSSSWRGKHGECHVVGDESTALRDEVLAKWQPLPALVFGSWKRPRPVTTRAVLIWDKGGHSGMGDLSIPWKPNTDEIDVIGSGFIGKRDTSILRFAIYPEFNAKRHHPTEKPLQLITELLAKCPPGTILDPFMGSGTTLRACKDLGRKAIGIEVCEAYCEIAAKRLSQEVFDLGGME